MVPRTQSEFPLCRHTMSSIHYATPALYSKHFLWFSPGFYPASSAPLEPAKCSSRSNRQATTSAGANGMNILAIKRMDALSYRHYHPLTHTFRLSCAQNTPGGGYPPCTYASSSHRSASANCTPIQSSGWQNTNQASSRSYRCRKHGAGRSWRGTRSAPIRWTSSQHSSPISARYTATAPMATTQRWRAAWHASTDGQ